MAPRTSNATPTFLILLVAVATTLLVLIIAPFAASLFAAAVLAGVMAPLQRRTERAFGGRPVLAAAILTLGITVVGVAPLASLCVFVTQQALSLFEQAKTIQESEGVEGLIARLPGPLQWVADGAKKVLVPVDEPATSPAEPAAEPSPPEEPGAAPDGKDVKLPAGTVGKVAGAAAGVATTLFNGLVRILIDLGILLVALFFMLAHGNRLVRWVVKVVPLPDGEGDRLVTEFRDVTQAVFMATVVTAFLQSVLSAAGYWIAGIPYLPIAVLVTFLCALVPVIGAALVVIAIGGLLIASGSMGYGIFLILWGLLPVGLVDNVVKPWLARGKLRLPASVTLFAMLGGVAVFGPLGIVAGPLIVAFFLAALRMLRALPREE